MLITGQLRDYSQESGPWDAIMGLPGAGLVSVGVLMHQCHTTTPHTDSLTGRVNITEEVMFRGQEVVLVSLID